MHTQMGIERCFSFINCQIAPPNKPGPVVRDGFVRRAVTLSRQAGAGAHPVAEKLAEYLQARTPDTGCPWTVFDRNLVGKVLQDHHLPDRLARFMPEDCISEMSDVMDELFGLHPASWTLVRQSADTILRLAALGNAILIGRGAAVITSKLPHVFHVRLVGSVEKRAAHIQEVYKLSPKAALSYLRKEDRGRAKYLKKYFEADIDDPTLYHLTINTDVVPEDVAVQLIGDAVLRLHPVHAPA